MSKEWFIKTARSKRNEREGIIKESKNNITWFRWAIQGFIIVVVPHFPSTFKTLNILASPDPCSSLPPYLSTIKCLLHCWIVVIYNMTWKKEVKINKLGITSTESKDFMLAQLSTRCILTCDTYFKLAIILWLNESDIVRHKFWLILDPQEIFFLNPLWQKLGAGLVVDTFLFLKFKWLNMNTHMNYFQTHDCTDLPANILWKAIPQKVMILYWKKKKSEKKTCEIICPDARSHLPIWPYRQFVFNAG